MGCPIDEAAVLRRSVARRFPPPGAPFVGDYSERHRAFLQAALTEPALLKPFVRRGPLPAGYGIGLDERVIEYPWLLAKGIQGRVLDAGSILNHDHILDPVPGAS